MIENWKPIQTWEFLQSNPDAVLIDVRTKIEFSFVGHPLDAVHIPWKEAPDWSLNTGFVDQVKSVAADSSTPVLLLCRSGQRSMEAARTLEKAGYQHLINVDEGFEGTLDEDKHRGTMGGWRFYGLPWEQS